MIRRRCFATDGVRLVMPAFGAYAGGLNVLDEAFGPLFSRRQLEAWMMGRADVYPVLGSLLLPGLSIRGGRRPSRPVPPARRAGPRPARKSADG